MEPAAVLGDWADPGFFSKRAGQGGTLWRLLWMMLLPPEGHRIKPTPAGWVLMLVALGLGSAAYSTSSNILFMALSLLLSSLILSGFMSWLNFKGVSWRLKQPPSFRAGEPAQLQIELNNRKKLLPTYCLWFNVSSHNLRKTERIHLETRLNPKRQTALEWNLRPQQRGLDTLRVSGLESQFPFGFLRKSIGGGVRKEIIVLPPRIEYEFSPPGGHHSHLQGETNRRPGAGNELINLRRYQPGDPQRMVHWKASARQRVLVVRQMAEENRDGFVLFIESSASLWAEANKFDVLCAFAGSLAEDLFREGRLLAVAINDEPLQPIKRLHGLQHFLERLALLQTSDHFSPLPEAGGRNLITFRPGSGNEVHAIIHGNCAGTAYG